MFQVNIESLIDTLINLNFFPPPVLLRWTVGGRLRRGRRPKALVRRRGRRRRVRRRPRGRGRRRGEARRRKRRRSCRWAPARPREWKCSLSPPRGPPGRRRGSRGGCWSGRRGRRRRQPRPQPDTLAENYARRLEPSVKKKKAEVPSCRACVFVCVCVFWEAFSYKISKNKQNKTFKEVKMQRVTVRESAPSCW